MREFLDADQPMKEEPVYLFVDPTLSKQAISALKKKNQRIKARADAGSSDSVGLVKTTEAIQ